MSDSSIALRKKIANATDLRSVVRTMKALAASSVGQYQRSLRSLDDYYLTVGLSLGACLRLADPALIKTPHLKRGARYKINLVVFGSDQGLVGQFNERVADFTMTEARRFVHPPQVWVAGERLHARLKTSNLLLKGIFGLPHSIEAIVPLVNQILATIELPADSDRASELHLIYSKPGSGASYAPTRLQILPLDEKWQKKTLETHWLTKNRPQIISASGGTQDGLRGTLRALVREYLFISIFRACADSLASENESRLTAMQRAEKNINELLESLNQTFHRTRQATIDEELFDVVAGFQLGK